MINTNSEWCFSNTREKTSFCSSSTPNHGLDETVGTFVSGKHHHFTVWNGANNKQQQTNNRNESSAADGRVSFRRSRGRKPLE